MDSNEEMIKIRKEIVDFHGEMVLLENYSALNFTGMHYFPFAFPLPFLYVYALIGALGMVECIYTLLWSSSPSFIMMKILQY